MKMAVTKIPKKTVTLIQPKKSFIVDKEKHRQKRVAAYCRVSTGSDEQITSYNNQMKVYTEMIAANKEWEFAGLYADEGISGTRADKRPQFQKMIDDCLKGKIDMIITKSVSRFARNTVECLDYVRMLKEKGIGIYFEEQNIDTLKSDSELYLVIYAGFAQSESESISKNITWTHRKNFEEGKPIFMYSRWLGYKKGEDGTPEIVPEEAEVVRRIFDMYLSGKSTDEIANIMRSENITFPEKKLILSKSAIIRMLKNEKYCGDCILQKTITLDPISKKRKANEGEAPMWLVENSHPAIISRDVFNRVQEETSRRNAKAPASQKNALTATGKHSRYALTDVLMCGECGSRFRRVTWTARGNKRIVWRCISRLDYGKKYCPDSITVSEEALHRAIVKALNKFNAEDESTYLMLMKSTIGDAIGLNGGSDEIDLLERRIDALNKRMLDLVSESIQEGNDAESYEEEFKSISTQTEQLNGRINAIRESESEDGELQARLEEIQDTIANRKKNKDVYDDSIVRQMVECIKVYKDGRIQIILGGGYEIEEYLTKDGGEK
jgi:DNA invertase Pin-like site-specific DNA recombinase